MNSRLIRTLLSAACLAAPLALLPGTSANAQSVMRPAGDVNLSIGRGQLVSVPGTMADVFVANETIADVQVKSGSQLYVFGKAGGETTVYASNAAGTVIWSANVRVGSNIDTVDQMLRLAMPDAKIGVSTMGAGTFLLTGTVGAPEDAAEAERLVQAYVGKEANVISRLRTATPLQVSLRVKFAEVSRSLMRDIGTNLSSMDSTSGFKFGVSNNGQFYKDFIPGQVLGTQPAGVQVTLPSGVKVPGTSIIPAAGGAYTLGAAGKLLGLDLLGTLNAGEQVGLVSTLSEPNLTALSGETAEFLAGGEFPIPISQGLGSTSIEYKKYGVSLAYTPIVLSNGRISIRVRPEVSELSTQGAITINGFSVPALTTRRAETTVELGSGQSFMIAGLMSNNSQNAIKKMPGVGDMPILGSLFRSTNFRKGETELVIVVTPYLVNPVDASDIKLPTDGLKTPNEIERLFGNMDQSGKSRGTRPMPSAGPDRNVAAPAVSVTDPIDAPAVDQGKRDKKSRNRSAAAEVPAPGFNLK
jgi:pilus assembly protein CpaC